MCKSKWEFPGGNNLFPTGANHAGIETFLDDIPNSLTREIIQNSMDAKDEENMEPVRVEFLFKNIPTNVIPGIDDLKNNILPKARRYWYEKNNEDTINFIDGISSFLKEPTINVLKISDYNTVGLQENNARSLIEGDAYSVKSNRDSAGSKGIGKAAPFAASNLRMVLYNSIAKDNNRVNTGVINFVSFKDYKRGDNYITQSRGQLIHNNDIKVLLNTIGDSRNGRVGTDLLVIGVKKLERFKNNIILSVINNFLLSIYMNQLNVKVDDVEINKSTLDKTIKEIDMNHNNKTYKLKSEEYNRFRDTCTYYEVLTSKDTVRIYFPKSFIKEYDFLDSEQDGYLLLKLVKFATHRVLETRKIGMRINEKNRIDNTINFAGIFQAVGKSLNYFLRGLENVTHNQWSTDRVSDEKRKECDKFLKDLRSWYRACVKEQFSVDINNSIEAIGIKHLLPIRNNECYDKKDTGIFRKVKNINVIDRSKSSSVTTDGDGEERRLTQILKKIGEGENCGDGSRREGKGGGDCKNNQYGLGVESGNRGIDNDGEKNIISDFSKAINPDYLMLKIIEIDFKKGIYRLIGISTQYKEKIGISLVSVGENDYEYKKNILRVFSQSNVVRINKNIIIIEKIKKNHKFIIDFVIDERLRMRMKGIIYETKE